MRQILSFNFTKSEGNVAFSIKFEDSIDGIEFKNLPTTLNVLKDARKYWFDNSETKYGNYI